MIPDDRTYTHHHEWCRREGEFAVMGVTPLALKGLGRLIWVELPDEEDDVLCDVPYASIEGMRDTRDVSSLLDGVVERVNGAVAGNAELLVRDPWEKGWLIRIRVDDDSHERDMLSAADYKQLIGRKR